MGKQSKPRQSTLPAATQPRPTLSPDERSKQVDIALRAACDAMQCTPIFAQKMLDGQLQPLQNIPIVLCFVPNENIKKNEPNPPPTQ